MKRKVIQIANFTKVVSLPAKWSRLNKIQKGDELDVIEKGNSLILTAGRKPMGEKAEIDVTDSKSFKRRYLNTLYKKGYDEINITFNDFSIISEIKDEIELLLGFEIVSEGENFCKIKNVATTLDTEFETILRRVLLMLVSMAKDSCTAASNKEYNRLENIAELERTHNKLTNFCERSLNLSGYKENKETNFIYSMVWTLEQVADNLRDLCKYISDNKVNLNQDTLKLYNWTAEYIEAFHTLFYKRTDQDVDLFKDKYKLKLREQAAKLTHLSNDDMQAVYYLRSILDKIYHITLSFSQKHA